MDTPFDILDAVNQVSVQKHRVTRPESAAAKAAYAAVLAVSAAVTWALSSVAATVDRRLDRSTSAGRSFCALAFPIVHSSLVIGVAERFGVAYSSTAGILLMAVVGGGLWMHTAIAAGDIMRAQAVIEFSLEALIRR